jgi:hypothetical protein
MMAKGWRHRPQDGARITAMTGADCLGPFQRGERVMGAIS